MIQPMQHLSLLVFYKDYSSFVEELRGRGVLHIYEDKKKSAENVELGKKLVLLRQVNEISRLFVKRSRENACLPEGQALQWEQASSARDRLLFYCRLFQMDNILKEEVTDDDIAKVVSIWTGIPVSKMLGSEKEKYLNLDKTLSEKVIGQDEAIKAVSNAIRRNKAGISDEHRPLGSFLFAGPTGVGKTLLAKQLAFLLFDDEKALTRIDMSEYMEKFSVSRLIGAPPGYVGYEEGGQLTEVVRRRPYSVILFDEIEKAHPDVFNILLQVLDDGRLTDGQGRLVDFTNTIIIMTSNLGSEYILRDSEHAKENVMNAIRSAFKPEFVNRIDEIVVFNPLGENEVRKIVSKIMEAGFDPTFGARPIRRAIQNEVENPLSVFLLGSSGADSAKDVHLTLVDGAVHVE